MEASPEHTTGPLLAPPRLSPSPLKTGRKPQRSSPLAGPVVSVSEAEAETEDLPTLSRASSSPVLNHDCNFLSPHTLRPKVSFSHPRPKSMVSDYSTLSLHPQSLAARNHLHEPSPKQRIRPISAIVPSSAVIRDRYSHSAEDFRNLVEQNSIYGHIPPLPTSNLVSPSTSQLKPPKILVNEESIDVPQIPPPAMSKSRISRTIAKDNSWYIASAYEGSPRFSRLGLAASNVVMPVSAKEYKKCQQHRSGNRHSTYSPMANSDDSLAKAASGSKRSLLMSSTLAKLTKASDHQEASSPSPSPTQTSLSSNASNSSRESGSSPASSTTSSLSPDSSLSRTRTRTSSFTDSSSTYTCFMPESSRTSINEEATRGSSSIVHPGKDTHQLGKRLSMGGSKLFLGSKTKRTTVASGTLPTNPETRSVKGGVGGPVVDKNEKLRRGGTFRRFMKFFVSS